MKVGGNTTKPLKGTSGGRALCKHLLDMPSDYIERPTGDQDYENYIS